MPPEPPDLLVDPPATEWAATLLRRDHPRLRAFRRQLGLPADRPIVMTGHQPALWHCGVLAKFLAADAAARALGAAPATLLVDQDVGDPAAVRRPERGPDGRWTRREESLLDGGPEGVDVPFAAQAPRPPRRPLPPGFPADVAEALAETASGASAGRQVFAAALRLAEARVGPLGLAHDPDLSASELQGTDLFAELVRRMRADPHACVAAYNEAVRSRPEAGMRPLVCRASGRCELPLWRLRPGQARAAVYAHELDAIPARELAPRALLMTGLVRLAACDLFIHGTGGGDYDPVSESWFRAWAPDLVAELGFAPMTVVSATRRLPLAGRPVRPAEVDRAVWRAHHARHDPRLLGDAEAAAAKERCLADIARARAAGDAPHPAFAEMHALLERYRAAHAAELARLADEAADARARLLDAAILQDRTYPFVLFPADDLRRLRGEIDRAFGVRPEPVVAAAPHPAACRGPDA